MIYGENVLVFLVAPMVVGLFFLKGETRRFILFFVIGAVICLLCTYINSFIVAVTENTAEESVVRLTPVVEESMKVLPLLFYFFVFMPTSDEIWKSSIALGIGFATFENCCHVIISGAESFSYMLIRGFAAGIMHIVCAMIIGLGLRFIHERRHLIAVGVFSTVCMSITYHAVYNLLVSTDGMWQMIGYLMPLVTVVTFIVIGKTAKE